MKKQCDWKYILLAILWMVVLDIEQFGYKYFNIIYSESVILVAGLIDLFIFVWIIREGYKK